MFFGVYFMNLSLEILHTLLLPLVLSPALLISSKNRFVVFFFQSILDDVISQNDSCSLLLVYILILSVSVLRKRSNVLWGRRMCFLLLK